MPIFKWTFKIFYKALPVILLNFIMFTGISLLIGSFFKTPSEQIEMPKIAVINEDGDSYITSALEESLLDIAVVKEIGTSTKQIQDALFRNIVSLVLIIPDGYSDSFFTDNKIEVEKMTLPNSFAGIQVDNRVAQWTNTALAYKSQNFDEAYCISNASLDLKESIEQEILQTWKTKKLYMFSMYSKFALMTLFSLLGNIVVWPMITLNGNRRQRTLCSPLTSRSINMQVFLACGALAFGALFVYLLVATAVFGAAAFSVQGCWMMLNIVFLTLTMLALCFLITCLTKNVNAVNFLATALSLTLCFAGGAFVPQEFLGSGFSIFGMMTPAWWYVTNIDLAYNTSNFTGAVIGQQFANIGIVLAFGVLFLMAALLILRYKRVKR